MLAALAKHGSVGSAKKDLILQKSLDTYQGNFLAGFHLADTITYYRGLEVDTSATGNDLGSVSAIV